jgi:hypothetical protein
MNTPTSPPERPPEPGPPRGSCLGVLMIGTLISVSLFALNLVMMGIPSLVALIGGAILLISLFHYLVWGWWLGGMIRREVEAEESANDED